MRLKKTFWLLMLLAVPLSAAALMCDVCKKDIDGQYIKTSTGNYCSKKCYHSTIEKCSFCKEPCLRYTIRVQDMVFCSKKCKYNVFKCSVCSKGLEQIYYVENPYGERAYFCLDCRKLPHCYFCVMPSEGKEHFLLLLPRFRYFACPASCFFFIQSNSKSLIRHQSSF